MSRARLLRLFWIGAAAILVAAALLALVAVVGGNFDSTDGKILGSLGTLLLAGAAATVGGSLVEARRSRTFGAALVGTAPPLAAVGLASIWNGFDSEPLNRIAGSAYVLLATGLVVGTARTLVGERRRLAVLFAALAACAVAAAGLTIGAIASDRAGDTYGKGVAAAWILTVLAYLLVPVGRRLVGAPAAGGPRPVDLRAGVETAGARVRLATGSERLARETVVVVLTGSARIGATTVAAGDAVLAPAGTELEVGPETRALLVGRSS